MTTILNSIRIGTGREGSGHQGEERRKGRSIGKDGGSEHPTHLDGECKYPVR